MNLQKTKELIQLGKTKWQEGNVEEAIEAYERAMSISAKQPPWIYAQLGNGYLKKGEWERAFSAFQKAVELKPEHPEFNFKLAKCYEHQQLFARAISIYQRVIELDSHHSWVYFDLSNALLVTGKKDEAIFYLEQGILINPECHKFVYDKLLSIVLQQGQLETAAARYDRLTQENPTHAGFKFFQGILLEANGAIEEAVACYYQAQKLGLTQPWLYRRLENALVDLGKLDEIENLLQKLVIECPDRSDGLEGLARVAMRSKQFDLAVQRWQTVIDSFPEAISAYVGKGNALAEIGEFELAKAEFEGLKLKYSDRSEGLAGLAKMAMRQKEWSQALYYWNECVARFPNRVWMQVSRANTLIQLAEIEAAEASFQKITTEHPENPHAWQGLANTARCSGNLEQALKYCDYLQENFPDFVGGYVAREETLIEMGRFSEANQAFLDRPVQERHVYQRKTLPNFPPDLILPELVGVGNDYSFIEQQLSEFATSKKPYTLAVSIIIPVYNRSAMLAKTLAALTHQTYPAHLIEVVVVDDGSSEEIDRVIRKYEHYLNLIYVRQSDRGYRLSAARNLGARTARHDYLITIDCDILPYPELVESYMKYFHVSDRVILIGHRRYVCTDDITDDEILANINTAIDLPSIVPNNEVSARQTSIGECHDWRFALYVRNNYKKEQRWSFVGFSGGNEAHPRKAIQEAGEYDEDFQHWGAEDNEMGYRFYNAGYYFIPVIDAMSLHQEPPNGENETDRQAGKNITTLQLAEKCPAPIYRQYERGRLYAVPKVSIYIPVFNREQYIKQAVDSVLNQTYTDLEVCICNDGSTDGTLKVLEANYSDNPRVRWISQANGGISKASNAAVNMCRGMYIGQLDSDDFLKPNAVELAVNYLDDRDVSCVYSSAEIVDKAGNYVRTLTRHVEFSRESFLLSMLASHFRMFRKRDWCRTSGFDEDLTSAVDYDMYLKLSEVGHLHHISSTNYCYRWHGENTSVISKRKQESNHLLVINKALSRLGLAEQWEAISKNINNPRDVQLIRNSEIK
ncbi:MAG: glycosyltransferase [Pleurocapsa sp. MO_226.B13]|nr:glycosyltransferase [Pleurocapsa sp. MO_226.B13]